MGDKTYNGYTNYETWAVSLWLDNEQSSQAYWLREARHTTVNRLADQLKDEHEAALPEVEGFAADLLNAAMSEVNWHEIAEGLIETATEGDEDDEDDEDEIA